jgi:hypothetical protein
VLPSVIDYETVFDVLRNLEPSDNCLQVTSDR